MQVMAVEDRSHAGQRVAGDGRDFGLGASGERQSGHRRAAEIVEGQFSDPEPFGDFAEIRLEIPLRPPVAIGENDRASPWRLVERSLEWHADRDHDPDPGL